MKIPRTLGSRSFIEVKLVNHIKENESIEFTKTDLKKILINLLSNSIKFTNQGSITVFLENNSLIVQDTGVGIEAQECKKIFQPFYTVDASKNRLKSGFGLGLAIAKNLAQKNEYSLKCDIEQKNGCKIILSQIEKAGVTRSPRIDLEGFHHVVNKSVENGKSL